jgi:CDP-diacylglycerol--serine O-phosphatidyltransferase
LKRHIPNAITCCNLVSGCIATYNAFYGDYVWALAFIVLGATFDFFDGMSARLLNVSSPIGKELDSLADNVTFGLAPSAMLFTLLRSMALPEPLATHIHTWLSYSVFLMAAFSALRLAKFNLDERQTSAFIGLPTPANALFWGSLICSVSPWIVTAPAYFAPILLLMMLCSCWILVAELPLFALKFKHWGWKGNEWRWSFIGGSALLIGALGLPGIAATIVWYVVLNLIGNKRQ